MNNKEIPTSTFFRVFLKKKDYFHPAFFIDIYFVFKNIWKIIILQFSVFNHLTLKNAYLHKYPPFTRLKNLSFSEISFLLFSFHAINLSFDFLASVFGIINVLIRLMKMKYKSLIVK